MTPRFRALHLFTLGTACLLGACPPDPEPRTALCVAGTSVAGGCTCADGTPGQSVCGADLVATCMCSGWSDVAGTTATTAGVGTTAGSTALAGMMASAGTTAGQTAGLMDGGLGGTGSAGELAADSGTNGMDAAASDDPFAALRQACVDEINKYRATLSLPPLSRATASEESCSDEGAKLDHETGKAHASAAPMALTCRDYGVAQNACPDWPYGGRAGTQEEQLKQCLKQMWAEGEPAEGIEACVQKYFAGDQACFLAHGHYINMVSTDSEQVSCGFHDSGGVLWMDQDFR